MHSLMSPTSEIAGSPCSPPHLRAAETLGFHVLTQTSNSHNPRGWPSPGGTEQAWEPTQEAGLREAAARSSLPCRLLLRKVSLGLVATSSGPLSLL